MVREQKLALPYCKKKKADLHCLKLNLAYTAFHQLKSFAFFVKRNKEDSSDDEDNAETKKLRGQLNSE